MGTPPRMTLPVITLLSAMLERPTEEWYGLELVELVNLKSGTLYPALLRLEEAGWLSSRWEEVDPSEVKRPRRRLYRFTGEGQAAATEMVEAHLRALAGVAERSAGRSAGRPATDRSPPGAPVPDARFV